MNTSSTLTDFTHYLRNADRSENTITGYGDDLGDFAKAERPALACHFAGHLAVRELHNEGLQANDPKFAAYVLKAVDGNDADIRRTLTLKWPNIFTKDFDWGVAVEPVKPAAKEPIGSTVTKK